MKRPLIAGLAWSVCAVASAQSLGTSGLASESIDTGFELRGGPTSITQNTDTATIIAANSVACGPASENAYYRRFDLDGDHGITGIFSVSDIDFGVEQATAPGGNQDLNITLYSIANADPTLLANLTMVGTATVNILDGATYIQNAVVAGMINGATDDLVVEILENDAVNLDNLFIGSNNLGQSGPSFIVAPPCGITEITDLAAIGFPGMHTIMVVNGTVGPADADLSVTITDNAMQPLTIGSQFDYTLTASNAGPGAATGVTVVNVLPSQASYVADSCAAGVVGSTVTWNVGNLGVAANAMCNVTVMVTGFGDLTNNATISGNENDPVPGNNAGASVLGGPVQGVPTLTPFGLVLLGLGLLAVYRYSVGRA